MVISDGPLSKEATTFAGFYCVGCGEVVLQARWDSVIGGPFCESCYAKFHEQLLCPCCKQPLPQTCPLCNQPWNGLPIDC